MNSRTYITAIIVGILSACTGQELDTDGPVAAVSIMVDTRGEVIHTAPINLNVSGKHYDYSLANNFALTPKDDDNKIYIAPGTTTLSVCAWGRVWYLLDDGISDVVMPIIYTNPTTAVNWSGDKPEIKLAFTPATARIKLQVKKDGTTANGIAILHGIAAPSSFWVDSKDVPPTLEVNADDVTLVTIGGFVQAIPGTVSAGAQLLSLTVDGKDYPIIATRPYTFLAGLEYTLTVTINSNGQAVVSGTVVEEFQQGDDIVIDEDNYLNGARIIANEADLIKFREDVNAGAVNLNALQVAHITLTEEWVPIGTSDKRYTGTFNGNDFAISGLKIDADDRKSQGLFGYTSDGAVLANVIIKEPEITSTSSCTGALVGFAGSTTISHCGVVGGTVKGNNLVGGLVGGADYTHIAGCYTTDTKVVGSNKVGGLVGDTSIDTRIAACYADATVTATSSFGGGLVGNNYYNSTIAFCYAAGAVNDTGSTCTYVGGLVGYNYSSISSCYATGAVSGNDPSGSLVGGNDRGGTAQYCCASGAVNGGVATVPTGTGNLAGAPTLGTLQNDNVNDLAINVWDGGTSYKGIIITKDIWKEESNGTIVLKSIR